MNGMTPYRIAKMLTEKEIPTPAGKTKWQSSTIESILTNEKYKGSALLQKQFIVDFLTKKRKINEGEIPQYWIEESHPAIISPEEFELVQAEILPRKSLGKQYNSKSIFAARIVCGDCGNFYGSKVWHSTSKYRRVIWRCNHKFNGVCKCNTPHLYEDAIKEKFIEVCNRIAPDKADFIASCREIVMMLSDCTALDKKIEEQYVHLNELAAAMQKFIKENAMHPQSEDFYKEKMAEYGKLKTKGEKVLKDLQSKKIARLSRKELLEGLIRDMEGTDLMVDTFDEKL